MDVLGSPTPADLLSKATYYQVVHTLRAALPAPISDSVEDAAKRDLAAIAHVASLLPANAEEAHLAAQYVAANAHALDCLRLARAYPDDTAVVVKCTAQSASMMREARGWRNALRRAQLDREKRTNDAAARDAAVATEQRALALPAEALVQPPPAPAPQSAPKADPVAEAESYALQHRKRAVLIRRLGRLPDRIDVGALSPAAVHVIVTGTTPILRALDEKPRRTTPLAA